MTVKQRLFAGPVARQEQKSLRAIIQAESEHAVQMSHAIQPPGAIGFQDDLTIAGGSKRMSTQFKLRSQGLVVVDLTIEIKPQLSRSVAHGLVTAR